MSEVLGCGIDIEELSRFKKNIPTPAHRNGFVETVYTPAEIQNNLRISPDISFPLGFSCKEALFKAFGISWTNSDISWKDIEILFNDESNLHNYTIRLNGYAKKIYDEMHCRHMDSFLEYNNKYVVFQVVILS
jgi:phosphopantetheine--protein transferase-like protein